MVCVCSLMSFFFFCHLTLTNAVENEKDVKSCTWCVFNLSKWTRLPAVGRPNLIVGFDSMKVHTQEYAASKEKKGSKETPLTQILTVNWKIFYF